MTSAMAIVATLKKTTLEAHLSSILEKTEEALEYAKLALKIGNIISSTLRTIRPHMDGLPTLSFTTAYETITLAETSISLAKQHQIKLVDTLKESILFSQDSEKPRLIEDSTLDPKPMLHTKKIHKIAKAYQIAISTALEKARFASRLGTAIGKKEFANFIDQLTSNPLEEVIRSSTIELIEFSAPLNLVQALTEDTAKTAKEYVDHFELLTRKMKKTATATEMVTIISEKDDLQKI